MQDKVAAAEFHSRAQKIQEIAQGIFDKSERKFLLKFVSDSVKLAEQSAKKVRGASGR